MRQALPQKLRTENDFKQNVFMKQSKSYEQFEWHIKAVRNIFVNREYVLKTSCYRFNLIISVPVFETNLAK